MARDQEERNFDEEEARRQAFLARLNQLDPEGGPQISAGDRGELSQGGTLLEQAAPTVGEPTARPSILERNEQSTASLSGADGAPSRNEGSVLSRVEDDQQDAISPRARIIAARQERIGENGDNRGGTPGEYEPRSAAIRSRLSEMEARAGVQVPEGLGEGAARRPTLGGIYAGLENVPGFNTAPSTQGRGREALITEPYREQGGTPPTEDERAQRFGELAPLLPLPGFGLGRVAGRLAAPIGERLTPFGEAIGKLINRGAGSAIGESGGEAINAARTGARGVESPAFRARAGRLAELEEREAAGAARTSQSPFAQTIEALTPEEQATLNAARQNAVRTNFPSPNIPGVVGGENIGEAAARAGAFQNAINRLGSLPTAVKVGVPLVAAGGVAALPRLRPAGSEGGYQGITQQPGEQTEQPPSGPPQPPAAAPGVQPPQVTPLPTPYTTPAPAGPGAAGPTLPTAPTGPGTPLPTPTPVGPGRPTTPVPVRPPEHGAPARPGAPLPGAAPAVGGPVGAAPGRPVFRPAPVGIPGAAPGGVVPGAAPVGTPVGARQPFVPVIQPGQTPTGPTTGPLPQGPLTSEALRTQVTADLNGIAQQLNAGPQAPDVMALFLSQGSKLIDLINQQEQALRSQSEAEGKQIDPATQNTLDVLRDQLDKQLKATRESLNSRGLLDSGILVEAEQMLRKGNLSDQAKILAERLSRIQNNLNTGLSQFRGQRIDTARGFGLAGAQAQTQAEQAERNRLEDLRRTLIQGRLGLGEQYGREEQNALERDFRGNESALDREFRSGESALDRQFRTGERLSTEEFQAQQAALNRAAAVAHYQAEIAARTGDRQAELEARARENEANRQNAQLIAEMNNATRQAGQNTPQPSAANIDVATNNVIASLQTANAAYDDVVATMNAYRSQPGYEGVDWSRVLAKFQQGGGLFGTGLFR